jgi:hypothetical protein
MSTNEVPGGLLLVYRETCGKCRALSAIAVLASLGGIKRRPLSSACSARLLRGGQMVRGGLMLFDERQRISGRHVLPAVLRRWARAVGIGDGRR